MRKNKKRGKRRIYALLLILAIVCLRVAVLGNNQIVEEDYTEIFVEAKDTLWSIARENAGKEANILRYIEQIKEYNDMKTSNLYAHTVLKVPKYKK